MGMLRLVGYWETLVKGRTSGRGYEGSFSSITAQVFRLDSTEAKDSPGVAELQLFSPE
jgi:hypothetical protein